MAGWNTLTAGVVGVGVGEAAGVALEPVLEPLKQDAWSKSKAKLLDLGTLGALVAQGLLDPQAAHSEALLQGYHPSRVDRVIQLSMKAAPVAELLTLWRRGLFGTPDPNNPPALVLHALAKEQIEPQYWPAITELFYGRLDPAVIAVAVQRGLLPNMGILPVGPPTVAGKVPPMPQVNLDPFTEAQASGIDQARIEVLTRIVGLPASPDLAARMVYRGIIDPADFDRAIAEGNTRNEWAPFLFEGFREIPTAHTFVQGHLRGWLTQAEMYAGSALHGMSKADTDLLFEVERRPLNPHAITTALARGGHFQPQPGEITDPYQASVHQANLGPEWYDLAVANKYTYPSAFVLRSLAEAGDLGNAQAVEQILLEVGWKPSLAQLVAAKWTTPTTGTGAGAVKIDPWVAKANNHLWTAVQKGYIGGSVDQANATQSLDLIGVNTTAQAEVFARWDETKRIEAL